MIYRLNHNWKGGVITSQGRTKIYSPDHPSVAHLKLKHRYVLEYRLIMEQKLGRLLKPEEFVVHKNGNLSDNRPENLEVVSRGDLNKKVKRVTEFLENGGDRKVFRNSKAKITA